MNFSTYPQQFQSQPYNYYQPQLKQYAIGSGIDNFEYTNITQACIQAYQTKQQPLSSVATNFIKKAIGGEWFVCCSNLGNKNFDFVLTSVTGGDFLSFSLDNVLFEVCRIR